MLSRVSRSDAMMPFWVSKMVEESEAQSYSDVEARLSCDVFDSGVMI